MWNENPNDDYDDRERYEEDWENACECGRPGTSSCDCCGLPLCVVCAECGANFCSICLQDSSTAEKVEQLYAQQAAKPDQEKLGRR